MIAVLGAGAMGSAIATHLVRAGEQVVVFATEYDGETVRAWRDGRPHPALGVVLPRDITIRNLIDARASLDEADMIVVAVSSPGLHSTLSRAAETAPKGAVWVLATKGWQEGTLMSPSELATSILGDRAAIVTLAGPALAAELALGSPTAVLQRLPTHRPVAWSRGR
jgi:glycerol-3-phosphate dehydrogenase (NAD(P)+)